MLNERQIEANIAAIQAEDALAGPIKPRVARRSRLNSLLNKVRIPMAGLAMLGGTLPALSGLSRAFDRQEVSEVAINAFSGNLSLEPSAAEADERTPSWFVVVSSQEIPDNGIEGKQGYTVEVPPGHSALVYVGPAGYEGTNGIAVIMEGQSQGEKEAGVFLINGGTPGLTFNLWGSENGGGNSLVTFTNPEGRALLTDNEIVAALGEAGRQIDKQHDNFSKPFGVITGYNGEVDVQGLITNAETDEIVVSEGSLDTSSAQPETQPVTEPTVTQTTGTTQPGFEGEQEVIPATQDIPFSLQPGVVTRVPRGSILRGEVGFVKDGRFVFPYDSNPETGMVVVTDADVDIISNYAASGILQVSGDINVRAQDIAEEIRASGCDGNGCGEGVFTAHYPNGPFQRQP